MSELYIYILNQNEIKKMSPSEILSMVSNEYQYIIGNNLCGIYVHGSIAFGCFNWDKSDIDFLVVVNEKLTQNQKESLISTLLRLNQVAPPKGFEMSVVLYQDCRDFKYPTPFQLHFSNAHLKRASDNLFEYCQTMNGVDCDLAAHFTVINKAGVVQYGKPINYVFGEVPKNDYIASIKSDVEDAENEIASNPVYIILNLCRVVAYMKDGFVLSKMEGGKWGLAHLQNEYTDVIKNALDCYTTDKELVIDNYTGQQFARYMNRIIFTA